MSCRTNSICDFCDVRCADYYEETEEYTATYSQIRMVDGTYEYCKVIQYKNPKYDKQSGKLKLFDIIIE